MTTIPGSFGQAGEPVGEDLLLFDAAGALAGWSKGMESRFPALAPLLAPGMPADRVAPALAGSGLEAAVSDLAGGGACWLCRPAGTADRLREADAAMERARAEAERAARAKDRFFTVANHDIRQPLAALSLFVGALQARLHEHGAREILRAMEAALSTLKSLVDVHIDMARIDAGVLRPEPRNLPVNAMITRMALEFSGAAQAKGLRLQVQPCSAAVTTDRDLTERMLRNLISNAIRYTDRGGVLLGCRRRGDRLRLEVWDTGRGIGSDELPLVFEEFWRGEPDTGDREGFGLGLAVVERLSRLLDHPVEVRSAAGRGTVFSILLPLAEETEPPGLPYPAFPFPAGLDGQDAGDEEEEDEEEMAVAMAGAQDAQGKATVMIVEDDRHVLQGLHLLLAQWGCRVVEASSADEALARIAEGVQPDMAIADLRLGGSASGIAAIRLASKALGRDLPGLILTGDTDPRRLREAKLSGYPLLHKPIGAHSLRGAVNALLGMRLR
jgi:two-component system, sensor histidine kinase